MHALKCSSHKTGPYIPSLMVSVSTETFWKSIHAMKSEPEFYQLRKDHWTPLLWAEGLADCRRVALFWVGWRLCGSMFYERLFTWRCDFCYVKRDDLWNHDYLHSHWQASVWIPLVCWIYLSLSIGNCCFYMLRLHLLLLAVYKTFRSAQNTQCSVAYRGWNFCLHSKYS